MISLILKKKSRVQLVFSCYPDQKPQRYSLIKQEAKEKGIDSSDFNKLHRELKKKGRIVNNKGEKWIKI